MSYRYVYDPVAVKEYIEAVNWYLERSEQATTGFIKEIKEAIAVICKYPFPIGTYNKYREAYHHKRHPHSKYRK